MDKKSRLGVSPGWQGEGEEVRWMGIWGIFWNRWAMGSYFTAQGNVCVIGSPCCITKPDETL